MGNDQRIKVARAVPGRLHTRISSAKRLTQFGVFCIAIAIGVSAGAAENKTLDKVESEVYQAPLDQKSLTKRAVICINQTLKPGIVSAPTILSTDLEAGVIVANSSVVINVGLVPRTVRSTFTLQAKEGRFRIIQSDIEQLLGGPGPSTGWIPVGLWRFAGGERVQAGLVNIADQVASCVKASAKPDNW